MLDPSGIETALSALQYGHSTVVDDIRRGILQHDMKIVVDRDRPRHDRTRKPLPSDSHRYA
jgi:hypothetical protein